MGRPSQWHGTNSENECIRVETVALDDFFSGMDVRPSLVKMDIEGAEPLALRGMQHLLAVTSAVILEMNPDHLDARAARGLLEDLAGAGFQFVVLDDRREQLAAASPEEVLRRFLALTRCGLINLLCTREGGDVERLLSRAQPART
jgi:hypothetical protein